MSAPGSWPLRRAAQGAGPVERYGPQPVDHDLLQRLVF
jgi:hypothetical protein